MKFKVDHDYHIHSHLSLCSGDPEQTTQNILRYAHENNFKRICLTDHFWDEKVEGAIDWYKPQNLVHVRQSLPLPQEEGIRFFFGVEADMDKFFRLGIAEETFGQFDFVIIPTTHLHMNGFTLENGVTDNAVRAQLWFDRLAALLQKPLPWHKIGIAHLTCPLIGGSDRKAHTSIRLFTTTKSWKPFWTYIGSQRRKIANFTWVAMPILPIICGQRRISLRKSLICWDWTSKTSSISDGKERLPCEISPCKVKRT